MPACRWSISSAASLNPAREARKSANAVIIAEQGRWCTAMIWPLLALPVIIYLWKVIVWDKVLGLGTTDAIGGDVGVWAACPKIRASATTRVRVVAHS
jgi:hypothetical protein